jgi:RNA polymerase sigma-70 factor (ECF subfamily)
MESFEALYERHYRDVYRFALFLTGDPARAEDLAADTFVRAWMARDRIRQPTVRSYLLAITRNLYRDHCRSRQPIAVDLDDAARDESPDAHTRVQHRSELRHVRSRLEHVAAGDRRALLLYAIRDLSYAEVAVILRISVNSVKSRIARARDALRMSV